jgi:pimeloyl-ACP methyl ester carboxylesterase
MVSPSTRPAPWSFAAPWGARGWVTDLDGPVHWIEFERPTNGQLASVRATETRAAEQPAGANRPPIVFVHGLGGSHLNWVTIGPALAADRRAVALDLRGFGLTPGTRRTATVPANVALLDRFVREVVGAPVILVGNSMGGLISMFHAHAHPDTVAGLVLVSPALPRLGQRPELRVAAQFLAYALPGVGELYLRGARSAVPPRRLVELMLELCFADLSRAPRELVDALVALATERRRMSGTDAAFLAAARSTLWSIAVARRYQAVMRAIGVPVLLLSGEADRLVNVGSARAASRANPAWETRFFPGVGHTAQMEVPELVSRTITDWLARHAASAPTRDTAAVRPD